MAIQELAERFGFSVGCVRDLLAGMEAQPTVTRELLLRRFVEAWLQEQQEEYQSGKQGD